MNSLQPILTNSKSFISLTNIKPLYQQVNKPISINKNYGINNHLLCQSESLTTISRKHTLETNIITSNLKLIDYERINFNLILKSYYSQNVTDNKDNSSDDKKNTSSEKEETKKEKINENENENENEKKDERKKNIYSIVLGLTAISMLGTLKVHRKLLEAQLEEVEETTQIKIEGSALGKFYSILPLRILSRVAGKIMNITLPLSYRERLIRGFAHLFKCNLDEIESDDLSKYSSFGAFFYRYLKPDSRPIDSKSELVSPVDARVLQFGEVIDGNIEQVKGITYKVTALLGFKNHGMKIPNVSKEEINNDGKLQIRSRNRDVKRSRMSRRKRRNNEYVVDKTPEEVAELVKRDESQRNISDQKFSNLYHIPKSSSSTTLNNKLNKPEKLIHPNNKLFYCVLYLSPSDYHHFHSPTNWVIEKARHFSGKLLSVAPKFTNLVHNLFVVNERVVLLGRWKHGFFSMIPVGATNVGSIKISFDEKLSTNKPFRKSPIRRKWVKRGIYTERNYEGYSSILKGIRLHKGEELGGFQFGSTVVLVFEAPKNFKFKLEPNTKVKMGQSIC